jgi:hypothetical protein
MMKQRMDADAMEKETEGNALIAKLRQQSQDNKEKNSLIIRQKTLENDQVSQIMHYVICTPSFVMLIAVFTPSVMF